MKSSEHDFKKDSANLKRFEDAADAARKEVEALNYVEGSAGQQEERRRQVKAEVNALDRKVYSDHLS